MNSVRSAQRPIGKKEDRATRMLTDRRLFVQYRRDGNQAARAALVDRFLPLARQLARRYEGSGEPLDDLVQVASVGLLKAIDRFDVDRRTAFSSFAVPTILGELRRHFRDKGWSVRVPRDLQELAMRVTRVTEDLAGASSHMPTVDEIARHIGVTPEQVLEAREAAGAHRAMSLDRPADDAEDAVAVADTFGVVEAGYGHAEDALSVAHLMRGLGEREREMLRMRFAEDLTQTEIGARVGVSQMHVSRLIRQALAHLGETAEAEHFQHSEAA
jgi:RNA polymerase sigma-B factor